MRKRKSVTTLFQFSSLSSENILTEMVENFPVFLFLFSALVCGVSGLKEVEIRVPEAVRVGDSVKLACDYDLEQAALYSIKWYQGDQEFYRYVPKESPPTRVFVLPGVKVDIHLSNAQEVTLRDVQRDMTGFYKCEVSADAPLFHTEIKSALMIVADVPDDNPILQSEKLKYSLGERIRANCTSSPSYPASNLTWFINGQPVTSSSRTRIIPSIKQEASGLESTRMTLELEASSGVFREGKLKLRCLATLFTFFRRSEEMEILEDTPKIAPVMGPTAPHSTSDYATSSNKSFSTVLFLSAVLLVAAR